MAWSQVEREAAPIGAVPALRLVGDGRELLLLREADGLLIFDATSCAEDKATGEMLTTSQPADELARYVSQVEDSDHGCWLLIQPTPTAVGEVQSPACPFVLRGRRSTVTFRYHEIN
jgi:hypothetical protein